MFQFTVILVFLAAAFLQGCAFGRTAAGVAPTDLTQVQLGSTAQEIESAPGSPIADRTVDDKKIRVYEITEGVEGHPEVFLLWPVAVVMVPGRVASVELCNVQADCNIKVENQAQWAERALAIIYESDDTAIYIIQALTVEVALNYSEAWILANKGDPEAQYQMGSRFEADRATREKWLRLAAEQGHVEAMYSLGVISGEESREKWHWYCQAATRANAEAQFTMGQAFAAESGEVERNLVMAYLWLNAAKSNGYDLNIYGTPQYVKTEGGWICCDYRTRIDDLKERMTSPQIAESESLLTEWGPTPADCYEPDKAQASN
jgi:hypothetical protein